MQSIVEVSTDKGVALRASRYRASVNRLQSGRSWALRNPTEGIYA